MGTNRRTRYERIAPPPPKARKPRVRVPEDAWEQEARYRGWFPFEREYYSSTHVYVPEEIVQINDEDKPVETQVRRRRVERSEVHTVMRHVTANALLQAYISGYVDVVRYLDELPFIIRQHSKSKRLLKDVNAFIARIKDDLKSGRRTF